MSAQSLVQTRCVMFDLDGTLVDSAPDIAISMNKMLLELNFPPHDLAQVRDWIGNGAGRLIKRALTGQLDGEPPEGLFKQAHQLFFDIYEQHIHVESAMYPGVLEGLMALREQSYILACITNKPRRFTPPLMEAFKIDHFFDYLICGDDLTVKKPDPQVLQAILKQTNLSPQQAIMVGDSASDIKAAQLANMKSFCVSYGYHQGKGVDALGADYIIDSIAEIPQYLLSTA
ncbi:MAG: phosphoglycolate phosphatase [Gammaproteobacteria bacterium]|nr:MAG: phosphoglycolate phosphatase [Gammaproteobacteria bacterium]